MKVMVISTKPIDADRAIRLQDYVNGVSSQLKGIPCHTLKP